MFTCFICHEAFSCHKSLILHLKTLHYTTVNSVLLCGQDGCVRTFNNIYPFKRHLISKHPETPKQSINITPQVIRPNLNIFENFDKDPNSGICNPVQDNASSSNVTDSRNFTEVVKHSAANFISNLYNSNVVTKTHVQDIVLNTTEFLGSGFISQVKDEVLKTLIESNVDENTISNIEYKFNVLENPFSDLQTEYKRMKYFKNCGLLIEPQPFVVGQSLENKLVDKVTQIVPTVKTGQIVPLREVLKSFLELPGVFDSVMTYINEIQTCCNVLTNFMQGSLWKSISSSFGDRLILPLFLYFDDFETNNPLGSRAGIHKLGSVYVSLPCIPNEFRSNLKNIFLAMLFYTKDRSEFGNRAVFQPLINELLFLFETGISIHSNKSDCTNQVHFALSLVLGDNLGINSIQGFTESFSANYPCRICKAPKHMIKTMSVEDKTLSRTEDSYNVDTFSLEETGIKEVSVWNDLPSFHSVVNTSCDIMHDLYEGVCRYDMSNIILHCLSCKYFTLDTLNERIYYFEYGPIENNNKPPNINLEKLKNKNLGFSATEMLCFVRHFSLIIGDLIPSEDIIWDFYLTLSQIISITSMIALQSDCVNLLRTLIQEHNDMYISLFKETLKPKHHFLIHYPDLILRIGPLVHVSSMRFEAKHKDFKQAAHVSASRKNLPYSLAMKHQLKLCYRLHTKEGLVLETIAGQCDQVDVNDLFKSELDIMDDPPIELFDYNLKLSWVKIGGITYKPSEAVIVQVEKNYLPKFANISCILSNSDREICLLCQCYKTVCYEIHYNAYKVELQDKWKFIFIKDLINKHPVYCHKLTNGHKYILIR